MIARIRVRVRPQSAQVQHAEYSPVLACALFLCAHGTPWRKALRLASQGRHGATRTDAPFEPNTIHQAAHSILPHIPPLKISQMTNHQVFWELARRANENGYPVTHEDQEHLEPARYVSIHSFPHDVL